MRKIAVRTENTEIKTKLLEELSVIKAKDADKDGKLKINPKDEIKELIGRSPDWSDNLLMRMWFELSSEALSEGKSATVSYPTNQVRYGMNYGQFGGYR